MLAPHTSQAAPFELTDAATLAADPAAWDDLVLRAAGPHPHFSRHVIETHRVHGLAPRDLAYVAVRRAGRLTAMLPYTVGFDVTGLGSRVAKPFSSPYTTATAPLAADGLDLPETLAALVEGLAAASGGRAWRWPMLSTGSVVGAGLLRAMREAGWTVGEVWNFERPVQDREANYDAFVNGHPHRSRLKDLERCRRRFAARGKLALETATGNGALERGVETFLALEAAGWKGEVGTAMACEAKTEAFARALFTSGGGPVTARTDTLTLDGRPLAINATLMVGGTACLLKTAYDETERALAPGLVLDAELIRTLHETGFADRLDSATAPGSALERLFRGREGIAEIIALPPGAARLHGVDRRVALARLERRAKAEAKKLLGRR